MAVKTEAKIDDRYGIVEPFIEWVEDELEELQDTNWKRGRAMGLAEAKAKLIELNKEAQRIADANRAEKP